MLEKKVTIVLPTDTARALMTSAAAQVAGCAILLTEDLSHGQQLGELHVVNPFLATLASVSI